MVFLYLFTNKKKDVLKKFVILSFVAIMLVGSVLRGFKKPKLTTNYQGTCLAMKPNVLYKNYKRDKILAKDKFYHKEIIFIGKITEVETDKIIIDEEIEVTLKQNNQNIKKGTLVHIKARITGFDDLYKLIEMDQGTFVKS